ncbi:MmgE/PrpD family protein [Acidisoma silvae]|uniref:MmgE/PrpD family protein n=1 Tax=Acidisoma silvae TaxID=2802396 RepID=A0A963YU15_9PROT|nr:MmgE/PrpD family protein [Acidisoma silvae]MCB8877048.1 MmgE/PrpD family protein [Acidisoma silvae]
MSALRTLAEWTASFDGNAIPAAVKAVAVTCLVDTMGVAIAGAATGVAVQARAFAARHAAQGSAYVLGGDGLRLAVPGAAFVNGTAAHALDFDDNCYAGIVHGSAIILPAALAVAEAIGASGLALLAAFIVGSEVEYAIGEATGATLYGHGWWTTGVFGPLGACAAACYLLRLDADTTGHALGIALSGTGGMKACFGTDAKPILAGRAAEAGVVAALLAAQGLTGPVDAVEHPRGFAAIFNKGNAASVDMPGARWRLCDPGIDVKRIPVCLSSHAAVDAVQALMVEHSIASDQISRIECFVPPIVIANLVHDRPHTPQQAQFSLNFAVAVTALFGTLTLAHLCQRVIAEPGVQSMMAKVQMQAASCSIMQRFKAPEAALVRLHLADGRMFEALRDLPRGAASLPLSATEIDAKFLGCTEAVLGQRAEPLLRGLRDVEQLPAASDIFDVMKSEAR